MHAHLAGRCCKNGINYFWVIVLIVIGAIISGVIELVEALINYVGRLISCVVEMIGVLIGRVVKYRKYVIYTIFLIVFYMGK